jgi:hypothetical protein
MKKWMVKELGELGETIVFLGQAIPVLIVIYLLLRAVSEP